MDNRIEEMTKETCGQQIYPYGKDRPICWLNNEDCTCRADNQCDHYEVCERIYKAGYRKIPEGAVVLTSNQKIWLEHEWYNLGFKEGVVAVQTQLKARFNPYYTEGLNEAIDEVCKELVDE